MGLSRRKFTREFKLAAVRRLEAGVSMAEAARGLEVSPNVLHRWQREFRQAQGLHSALGYLPPVEFEAQLAAQKREAAAQRMVA
jgi:transposase-like protein